MVGSWLPFFTWQKTDPEDFWDRFTNDHTRACYATTSRQLTCLTMISQAGLRRVAPVYYLRTASLTSS